QDVTAAALRWLLLNGPNDRGTYHKGRVTPRLNRGSSTAVVVGQGQKYTRGPSGLKLEVHHVGAGAAE
ncbi:hypothetical protein U1Q18_025013, partial [Sarracenia purpurea var. burkii]